MANSKDFKVTDIVQVSGQTTLKTGTTSTSQENYRIVDLDNEAVSSTIAGLSTPANIFFKADGLQVFLLDLGTNDNVERLSLSTAWDVTSTLTPVDSFSVSPQTTTPAWVQLSDTGRHMFVLSTGEDTVYEYDVDPAYDISAATFTQSQSFVPGGGGGFTSFAFNDDGTKIFFTEGSNTTMSFYTLSTPYDISSVGAESTQAISGATGNGQISFADNGSLMLWLDITNNNLLLFTLSTAYDLSTATLKETKTNIDTDLRSPVFGDSGNNVIFVNRIDDNLYAYDAEVDVLSVDLSTGNYFEIDTSGYEELSFTNPPASQTFQVLQKGGTGFGLNVSGTATEVLSYDIAIDENNDPYPADENVFITDDGRHMMYTGSGSAVGTIIIRLNKPYDIQSGVVIDSSANISGNDGIYLRSDGRKAYFSRNTEIRQYNMDTPFTMPGSASYTSSIAGGNIYFKPDGTRFICTGVVSGLTISTFDLSTPWDLSTATDASKDFAFVTTPKMIKFSTEGDRLYLGSANVAYSYSLTTPWDVTSASLLGTITIGSTGTDRMIIHSSENKIFRFQVENTEVYDISATFFSPVYRDTVNFTGGTAPTYNQDCNRKLITFSTDDGGATYYAGYQDVYI